MLDRSSGNSLIALCLLAMVTASCSLKKRAVNTLAEVLGEAEAVYLSDEDPELVAAALPFNIKTIETLLRSSPNHRGLLLTATKTLMFYTYGFVEPEASRIEAQDFYRAQEIRHRAFRLYMRGYRYGLRGLEVSHPGFAELLPRDPEQAASQLRLDDVPLAVWTGAALGAAVGVSKTDPDVTADINVVGALLKRALELDEGFEEGTIHEFLVSYESQHVGGTVEKARRHYDRALQLSQGKRGATRLAWAENISINQQNREEFVELIDQVLALDVDAHPQNRLLNILAQRRARSLRDRLDEFFLEGETPR